MLRRASIILLGTLGLAACQSQTGAPLGVNQPPGASAGPVAILLPLSGPLADVGRPMLRAAQLSLSGAGSPALIVKDTRGNPEGAVVAAREAIAGGARMLLGPLTSAETAQVGPVARGAGVPVLAFTNDQGQSQPGVWTLGITPGQQVRRLITAVRAGGREPMAALLPNNDFGKAMAAELTRIAETERSSPPFVRMHGPGATAINAVVSELVAAGPVGSILLGTTGNDLKSFAQAFSAAKIDRSKVQVLGPALWVDPASGSAMMVGAWFAGTDPDARHDLMRSYMAKYKESPPPSADLAHDAASVARVLNERGQMNESGLTQPVGFTGVDGIFTLSPDGQVRRGLALFRVERLRAVKIGGPS